MKSIVFGIVTLIVIVCAVQAFRQQAVGVRGRLMCGNQPPERHLSQTLEQKHTRRDDQLAAARTDGKGNFEISGGVGELLNMDVYFKVYHDCNDGIKPCQRKVQLGVLDEYVSRSDSVKKWFEAGTINMEFVFPNEERHCF